MEGSFEDLVGFFISFLTALLIGCVEFFEILWDSPKIPRITFSISRSCYLFEMPLESLNSSEISGALSLSLELSCQILAILPRNSLKSLQDSSEFP